MIDINGKGYITLSEFELVMESTQRLVNYVDEYCFYFSFILVLPNQVQEVLRSIRRQQK